MLQYPQIVAELGSELAAFGPRGVEITEDTDLLADLELDSLQVMNLLLQIEDRFDISIPVSILPDVRTVKDLALHIAHLTGER
jgi:acyl carrier protein